MKRLIFILIIGVSISCNNQKKENNNINKPEDSTIDYSVLDCSIVSGHYATGYEQGDLSKNDYTAKTNRDCEDGIEEMNRLRRMGGIGEYYPTNVNDDYRIKDCYCKGFYDGYDGNPQLHFE